MDRLEEEENEGGEQGDRAAKTAEVSYEEEGGEEVIGHCWPAMRENM